MAEQKQRMLGAQRGAAAVIPSSGVDENTKFKVGDDVSVLLDEVLNNKTRAVLIFDDFSGLFSDFELYQLSVVVKFNTSLVAITINGVDISDESVAMLCQALVPTNVQCIDFTNTPLSEEAGSSLAALARCNSNLRTVVVTDTLVSEEMMDEIDVACMDNETTGNELRVGVADPERPMYCVAHVFQACPNGEYCLLSHAPPGCSSSGAKELLNWEKALPPAPKAGASWRAGEDSDDDGDGTKKPKLRVNFDLMKRRAKRKQDEEEGSISSSVPSQSIPPSSADCPAAAAECADGSHRRVWARIAFGAVVAVVAALVIGRQTHSRRDTAR